MRRLISILLACLALGATPAAAQVSVGQLVLAVQTTPKERLDPVINRLLFLKSHRAAMAIADLLDASDPVVRDRAAYVLGFLRDPGTAPALVRVVDDPDWSVRRDAVFALGRMNEKRAVPAIAARLADARREVRIEAAKALYRLADRRAGPKLARALGKVGDDLELEMAIIHALGASGNRRAARVLLPLVSSKSESVRLASLRALARLGDVKARRKILVRLRAKDAYARDDAARLLAEVPARWATTALVHALSDPSPQVRLAAAESLGAQKDERGIRYLLQVADGTGKLSMKAADALARLSVPQKRIDALRRKMREERRRASLDGGTEGPTGAAGPPPWPSPAPAVPPEQLASSLRSSGTPFLGRVVALSADLRGVPYLESPLGEGAGFDPDPLIRFDAVDCVTYVEEVLALANAPSKDTLLRTLIDVRYTDGRVAFGHRNHLMMDEWVPDNVRKGYLRDVTRKVGGKLVVLAKKTLTASEWVHRRGVDLPLATSEIPLTTSTLPIIPIARFPEVMDKIPSGTILLVVRTDRPTHPNRVTHLGFVIEKHGRMYLRHAAKVWWHRVTDERLADFVKRNAGYVKWPVVGFSLLEPVENSGRVARLDPRR